MSLFHKSERQIITLNGDNPAGFLHDILTANSTSIAIGEMRQSCLLSPQGRILFEIGLYPKSDDEILIEIDANQADEFMRKLQLYKLRRKITITKNDDLAILAGFDEKPDMPAFFATDTRHKDMGWLGIISKDHITNMPFDDEDSYHAKRISLAVPEGARDLTPNRALMLEAGLEITNAVDFQKGCYIGQEVTARTRYRGLVKRRLVPVIGDKIETGMVITSDNKEVGIIHSVASYDNAMIGLASIKLVSLLAGDKNEADLETETTKLSLAIPPHLRPLPEPS